MAVSHEGFESGHVAMADSFSNLIASLQALRELLLVVAWWSRPDSEGLMGGVGGFVFNFYRSIGVTVGQVDVGVFHVCQLEKYGGAIFVEAACYDVVEALGELECSSSGPKEAFPDLGFFLQIGGNLLGGVVIGEHFFQAEVEYVGHVIDKAIASALMEKVEVGSQNLAPL